MKLLLLAVLFLVTDIFHVQAGKAFSITHSRRTVKAHLLECDDAQKPPQTVDYIRWNNTANEVTFILPVEAVGCSYNIGGLTSLVESQK